MCVFGKNPPLLSAKILALTSDGCVILCARHGTSVGHVEQEETETEPWFSMVHIG